MYLTPLSSHIANLSCVCVFPSVPLTPWPKFSTHPKKGLNRDWQRSRYSVLVERPSNSLVETRRPPSLRWKAHCSQTAMSASRWVESAGTLNRHINTSVTYIINNVGVPDHSMFSLYPQWLRCFLCYFYFGIFLCVVTFEIFLNSFLSVFWSSPSSWPCPAPCLSIWMYTTSASQHPGFSFSPCTGHAPSLPSLLWGKTASDKGRPKIKTSLLHMQPLKLIQFSQFNMWVSCHSVLPSGSRMCYVE